MRSAFHKNVLFRNLYNGLQIYNGVYVLSELSRSVCSKFVALSSSSIRESGFGLVTSTLHKIGLPAPSSVFFLRSSAALARSSDPVSLKPEPPEGFLRITHKLLSFSSYITRHFFSRYTEHWHGKRIYWVGN